MQRELILASGSPRRRELLELMNIPFTVCSVDVDENLSGEPDWVVSQLALRKARAAYALQPGRLCWLQISWSIEMEKRLVNQRIRKMLYVCCSSYPAV